MLDRAPFAPIPRDHLAELSIPAPGGDLGVCSNYPPEELAGGAQVEMGAGDVFVIETPGGGGYGT